MNVNIVNRFDFQHGVTRIYIQLKIIIRFKIQILSQNTINTYTNIFYLNTIKVDGPINKNE